MRHKIHCLAGLFLSLVAPALILALGAAQFCPGGACHIPAMDRDILVAMNSLRRAELDLLFQAATWCGSLALLLPLSVFILWRLRTRRAAASLFILSLAGAWLMAVAAKLWVQRPRPDFFPMLTVTPTDLSFPSAHAMQVAAFALGWLLFGRRGRGWGGLAGALALVASIAISRVYLQVHFPSDVAFGLAAAAAWALGLRFFLAGPLHRLLAAEPPPATGSCSPSPPAAG